jgi:hypothetical protein
MGIEELEARVKELEKQVKTIQDIESIKKLQRAYGYYIEHMMSQEIIDCFADGPGVELSLLEGTYLGKDGVKRYFGRGTREVSPEMIHQVMQLSPIVDVDPDGKTAKGRWYGWGAVAIPWGAGVRQMFMSGIYECVYIKEDGVWKIWKLKYSMHFAVPPDKGWVKPDRLAAAEASHVEFPQPQPDIYQDFNYTYPSGYIFPFHYKHPVTGKETSEPKRNASLKLKPSPYAKK